MSATGLHRLLKRQINKYLDGQANVPGLEGFLMAVNDAYFTFELDYKQLDRTLELSSDELFKVNQELKKVNEELDRFVYSASHDLKAPLSSVLGLINIARLETANPDKMMEYLDMMDQRVHRLMDVIADLSDYTRNARLEVAKETIDLHRIVDLAIQKLKYIKGASDVNVVVDISTPNVPFISDHYRISIIIENLLSNCFRYHNHFQENPTVWISLKSDRFYSVLSVADNGLGIGKEHLGKIFDMFYRGTDYSNGSGLGLFIVWQVLQKLKGKVTVASEPGKGSSFTFELPTV